MPLSDFSEEARTSAQTYNTQVAGKLWEPADLPDADLTSLGVDSDAFAERVFTLQEEELLHADGKLGPRTLHALVVRKMEQEVLAEQQGPLDLGWWRFDEDWPEASAILAVDAPNHEEPLDSYLRRQGIYHFSAYELTRLRHWQRNLEPLRGDWPRIIPTLRLAEIVRHGLADKPLLVIDGYRPRRYNAAVGGAPRSQHQTFRAVLLQLHHTNADDPVQQRAFYEIAAKLYARYGEDLKMGIGFYRAERGARISLDTGFNQRTWEQQFVEQVLSDLGIA